MAKSSRASSRKANNQRLKANVFGPVEAARQERLAAKLLAIASQPKPVSERKMEDVPEEDDAEQQKPEGEQKADDSKTSGSRFPFTSPATRSLWPVHTGMEWCTPYMRTVLR